MEGENNNPPAPPAPAPQNNTDLEAARKEAADLKAKLKALEDRDLSELQKAQKAAAELDPLRKRMERYEATAKAELDASLKGLPKDQRERVTSALERVADPLDRLELLKALAPAGEAPKAPAIDRSAPARPEGAPRTYTEWKALPDDQRRKWRDIAYDLPN